jgi:death-on-curing protein
VSEPTWIELDELIEFNRLVVADTGEPFNVLNVNLLDSSVHRPRHILHYKSVEDVIALGCALAGSIAQNHAFEQGNKRTAQAALFRFLWINGFTFRNPDDAELAEALINLVDHLISEEEYFDAIDGHVIER